jgi:alpha-tubulin suppressor-like RCC1 family protein
MGQLGVPQGREDDCQGEDYQQEVESPGRCAGALRVPGIDATREIALGGEHTCALRNDGSIRCWGSNWFGALGVGDAPDRCPQEECARSPMLVAELRARSIAAGGDVTCAVTTDERVACWGEGRFGQMGTVRGLDACTVTHERCARRPRIVPGLDRVVQVAVGGWHVCALRDDGTVWCWGADMFGQLGTGGASDRECDGYACNATPSLVPGVRAVHIAAGAFHTCALLGDGGLACWGRDDLGQLGGPPAPDQCKLGRGLGNIPCARSPRPIGSFAKLERLADGATCAVAVGGATWCWGSDIFHQLGAATPAKDRCRNNGEQEVPCSRAPVQVTSAGTVRGLATNGATTCATRDDGSILCWGANGAGQAGPSERRPTLCEFLPGQKEPCITAPREVTRP